MKIIVDKECWRVIEQLLDIALKTLWIKELANINTILGSIEYQKEEEIKGE